MGTKRQDAQRRHENVAKMQAQLAAWSARLDALEAGIATAGAPAGDAERERVEGLRALHGMVLGRLEWFIGPNSSGCTWGTFRGTLVMQWKALSDGLREPAE